MAGMELSGEEGAEKRGGCKVTARVPSAKDRTGSQEDTQVARRVLNTSQESVEQPERYQRAGESRTPNYPEGTKRQGEWRKNVERADQLGGMSLLVERCRMDRAC